MKHYLLLALTLAMTGCRPEDNQREVLTRLKALEAEMAKLPRTAPPVRWATADRSKIANALYARSREKLEELKQTEKLSSEQEAKVSQYEALNRELMNRGPRLPSSFLRPLRPAPTPLPPLPPRELSGGLNPLPLPASLPTPPRPTDPPAPTAEEKEYDALVKRVAEAKAPVAAIIDRRAQITAKYFNPQLVEQIVADYVKEKQASYDLVVDVSQDHSSSHTILHRAAGEVPDITEGVIKFFREREKP